MSSIPGSAVVAADQMRAFRGYSTITQEIPRGWFTAHTLQLSINRRFSRGLAYGFNDTIVLSQRGITGARLQHNPDGSFSERPDQPQADRLLRDYVPNRQIFKAYFVWELPGVKRGGGTPVQHALKWMTNDWRLSGVWTASTAGAYTVGLSYQGGGSQNITGSPNYGGRVRILSNPGSVHQLRESRPPRLQRQVVFSEPAVHPSRRTSEFATNDNKQSSS